MKTKIVRKLLALMVLAATAMSTSGSVSASVREQEDLVLDYNGIENFHGLEGLAALLALVGAGEGAMEEEGGEEHDVDDYEFVESVEQKIESGQFPTNQEDIKQTVITLRACADEQGLRERIVQIVVDLLDKNLLENFKVLNLVEMVEMLKKCADEDALIATVSQVIERLVCETVVEDKIDGEEEASIDMYLSYILDVLDKCLKGDDINANVNVAKAVCALAFRPSCHKNLKLNISSVIDILDKCSQSNAVGLKACVAKAIGGFLFNNNLYYVLKNNVSKIIEILERCSSDGCATEDVESDIDMLIMGNFVNQNEKEKVLKILNKI